MKVGLTKKQRMVLDFVTSFLEDKGYAPSYREIAEELGLSSVSTIHEHVRGLQAKGYLDPEVEGQRSLEPTMKAQPQPSAAVVEIPLVGLITAGQPIEALVEHEQLAVPQGMVGRGRYYSLRVKGDSMIEDGIFDGDYVIIEERDHAQDGEIVVALLENQFATLKRFYQEKDHVRLQPANASMEPFRVKDVTVQGRVVGLIRRYRSLAR
ncbi:MAG: transcriptional repressor LexA [Candidatus Andersenbacteria bacterium]